MEAPTAQGFEWKIGYDEDAEKWIVIDYDGQKHAFKTEAEGRAYIDRDKRMFAKHTKAVWDEMMGGTNAEQAAYGEGETEEAEKEPPRPLNRKDRRRVSRLAGRQPSSARTRRSPGDRRKGF